MDLRSTVMLFIHIVVLIFLITLGEFAMPFAYFDPLYKTTIPHAKLKSRLLKLIKNAFRYKNGYKRYENIVVGSTSTYFVKNTSNANNKYTENDVIEMLDFSIDNIFVEC